MIYICYSLARFQAFKMHRSPCGRYALPRAIGLDTNLSFPSSGIHTIGETRSRERM